MVVHVWGYFLCYVLLVEIECIRSAELDKDDYAYRTKSWYRHEHDKKKDTAQLETLEAMERGHSLGKFASVIVVIDRCMGPGPQTS